MGYAARGGHLIFSRNSQSISLAVDFYLLYFWSMVKKKWGEALVRETSVSIASSSVSFIFTSNFNVVIFPLYRVVFSLFPSHSCSCFSSCSSSFVCFPFTFRPWWSTEAGKEMPTDRPASDPGRIFHDRWVPKNPEESSAKIPARPSPSIFPLHGCHFCLFDYCRCHRSDVEMLVISISSVPVHPPRHGGDPWHETVLSLSLYLFLFHNFFTVIMKAIIKPRWYHQLSWLWAHGNVITMS